MPRSARVVDLFQYSSGFVTVSAGAFAIGFRFPEVYTLKTVIIFMVLLLITIIVGGSFSLQYVKLLKWVLQHLHLTKDDSWIVAFGISAICDVFLAAPNIIAVAVVSVLSMIMISVVAAGWDRDRSGMTEGFFIGFGKLFLVNVILAKILPAVLCGTVLLLAITSKLTEDAIGSTAGSGVHVGSTHSTRQTIGV